MQDVDSGEIKKYKLVGEDESEPENGFISVTSPVGSALIGKRVDDEIQVRVPGGIKGFLVLSIE